MNSLPLPLMSPRLTFSRFSSVFGRVIRWLPFFCFPILAFYFPFFFPSSFLNVLNVYTLFWFCIYPFFFSARFPLEFSTFYVQFFFSLSYTQTLHPRIRFHTPRPSPHKCIHVPTRRFVHALLQIHTRHTYTTCLLSAHTPLPYFFFLPLHTKKQFTTLSTLLYNLIKQISLS